MVAVNIIAQLCIVLLDCQSGERRAHKKVNCTFL